MILLFFTLFFETNSYCNELTLKELIKKIESHPEIIIEKFEIDKTKNLLNKVDGETLPKISILSGIGPNYSRNGNALDSSKSKKINTYTFLANVNIQIPLYAFNQNNHFKNAIKKNIEINNLEVLRKKHTLIKQAKQFYYGLQYATNLSHFANETLKDLDDAIQTLIANKSTKEDDISRLNIFKALVSTKKYEIQNAINQSNAGLKFIAQFHDTIKLDQDWIEFSPRELPSLSDLKKILLDNHIDYKRSSLGIEARESYLTAQKKSKLPSFGIFINADIRDTPKSQDQHSYFAYDPFNRSELAAGIGLIWDLDFGIKDSNIALAKIELEKVKLQNQFARTNLPLKIDVLFQELKNIEAKTNELELAYKDAKKALTKIAASLAIGLPNTSNLIEFYTLRAELYQQYQESIYQYEMKLAELSQELGVEVDPNLLN